MVQQGRLLAAALARGRRAWTRRGAEALLRRLDRRTEARLRIFGGDGACSPTPAAWGRGGPSRRDEAYSPAAQRPGPGQPLI